MEDTRRPQYQFGIGHLLTATVAVAVIAAACHYRSPTGVLVTASLGCVLLVDWLEPAATAPMARTIVLLLACMAVFIGLMALLSGGAG